MWESEEQFWVLLLLLAGFGLIGIIFLCIGIGLYTRDRKKRRICTEPVTATVAEMRHESVGAGDCSAVGDAALKSWFPVYEYTIGGVKHRAKAFVGTAEPKLKAGQTAELFVNPDRTDEFYCPTENTSRIRKVFIGVGVACLCLAAITGTFLLYTRTL